MTVEDPQIYPEDDLEPVELVKQSKVVMRTGLLLLSAGAGSYRVKAAMARVARALGIRKHRALVTATEITMTSHRGNIFRTEAGEIRSVGVDANRLAEFEKLVRTLPASTTADEVSARLDAIAHRRPLYPDWASALAAGAACSAFAFLNSGGLIECVGVLIAAFAGQYMRRVLHHHKFNQFGVVLLASLLACGVYMAFLQVLSLSGVPGHSHEAGFVSAVLFLVPGFALVTGALDLARLDYSAGLARVANALIVTLAAGIGVWSFASVGGLSTDIADPVSLAPGVLITLRALASFIGVFGFALMFSSTAPMALAAALTGMLANSGRFLLIEAGMAPQAAAFLAALVVGLITWSIAIRTHMPRTTIAVPAVVIMVPGVSAYRAIVHFNEGDPAGATGYAVTAVFVVLGIVVGLAVARMLTDREWAYER